MKTATIYYLFGIFAILLIFFSFYFQSSNREGLITDINPAIVNSDIPDGKGLSERLVLEYIDIYKNILNNTNITKIKIEGNGKDMETAGPLDGIANNDTIIILNGRKLGTIDQVANAMINGLKFVTAGVKTIRIKYDSLD